MGPELSADIEQEIEVAQLALRLRLAELEQRQQQASVLALQIAEARATRDELIQDLSETNEAIRWLGSELRVLTAPPKDWLASWFFALTLMLA